jgi:uncharacterized protein (UPF0335 family)
MVRRVPGPRAPKPKPTVGDLTHQLSNSGTEQQLLSFVERYERLTEEIGGLTEDRKEVMGEAKATGFDTKILRLVVAIRKLGLDQFLENESLRDTYLDAVRRAEAYRKANPGAAAPDNPEDAD